MSLRTIWDTLVTSRLTYVTQQEKEEKRKEKRREEKRREEKRREEKRREEKRREDESQEQMADSEAIVPYSNKSACTLLLDPQPPESS